MTHRLFARLSAWLVLSIATVTARLRAAPQRGQGTVEYVALILLVAGVLAVGVTAAKSSTYDFGKVVTTQLKAAIGKVSK